MNGNSRRYDLIVFDWDGTLMDSTGLIAQCIQWASADAGLAVPTRAMASRVIGLGLVDSTRTLFPGIDDATLRLVGERYRYHYLARDHEAPLFSGIAELLAEISLPERFLAVATGKSRLGLERVLDHSGLRAAFHYTRCADEGQPKPHPEMLEKLMGFTGVAPGRTLMIGDTTHDLWLAKNAGTDAVAVSYGAHDPASLSNAGAAAPRAVCASVADLRAWLLANG